MTTRMLFATMTALTVVLPQLAQAVVPTADEMTEARQWVAAKFENVDEPKNTAVPFSFTYDGKSSAGLLKTWKCKRASRQLDTQRTEHTLIYTDPRTGLKVRCVAIAYADYPAAEWVVYFENKGGKDTPILANVRALDTL